MNAPTINNADYQSGYAAGLADGRLINQPINTGGHTFEEYIRVRDAYAAALVPQDAYQAGYAEGVDQAAREAGYENPTDEQIDAFYDNL